MIRQAKRIYLLTAVCTVVLFVLFSNTLPVAVIDDSSSQNQSGIGGWRTEGGPQPKVILFWTSYFEQRNFSVGFGDAPFVNGRCLVSDCVTTSDRTLLAESDAVIFHSRNFDASDLPAYRLPRQRFVFFNYEAPPNSGLQSSQHLRHFFNWTMTYRLDSDVVSREPYGQLEPAQSAEPIVNLSGKNRTIAWFVSHCTTHSQREWFVAELSKHIDVDIYGNCGQLQCDPQGNCQRASYDLLRSRYRFYLSFENSLCRDYVTEKLFRPMSYDIVPIVYGAANYSKFLPDGSFIDIRHYRSPAELAAYLHQLMNDDEQYLSYFKWRSTYRIVQRPHDGWCRLCQMLHDPTLAPKSYPDVVRWWAGRSCRTTPTFWGQPPRLVAFSPANIIKMVGSYLTL